MDTAEFEKDWNKRFPFNPAQLMSIEREVKSVLIAVSIQRRESTSVMIQLM